MSKKSPAHDDSQGEIRDGLQSLQDGMQEIINDSLAAMGWDSEIGKATTKIKVGRNPDDDQWLIHLPEILKNPDAVSSIKKQDDHVEQVKLLAKAVQEQFHSRIDADLYTFKDGVYQSHPRTKSELYGEVCARLRSLQSYATDHQLPPASIIDKMQQRVKAENQREVLDSPISTEYDPVLTETIYRYNVARFKKPAKPLVHKEKGFVLLQINDDMELHTESSILAIRKVYADRLQAKAACGKIRVTAAKEALNLYDDTFGITVEEVQTTAGSPTIQKANILDPEHISLSSTTLNTSDYKNTLKSGEKKPKKGKTKYIKNAPKPELLTANVYKINSALNVQKFRAIKTQCYNHMRCWDSVSIPKVVVHAMSGNKKDMKSSQETLKKIGIETVILSVEDEVDLDYIGCPSTDMVPKGWGNLEFREFAINQAKVYFHLEEIERWINALKLVGENFSRNGLELLGFPIYVNICTSALISRLRAANANRDHRLALNPAQMKMLKEQMSETTQTSLAKLINVFSGWFPKNGTVHTTLVWFNDLLQSKVALNEFHQIEELDEESLVAFRSIYEHFYTYFITPLLDQTCVGDELAVLFKITPKQSLVMKSATEQFVAAVRRDELIFSTDDLKQCYPGIIHDNDIEFLNALRKKIQEEIFNKSQAFAKTVVDKTFRPIVDGDKKIGIQRAMIRNNLIDFATSHMRDQQLTAIYPGTDMLSVECGYHLVAAMNYDIQHANDRVEMSRIYGDVVYPMMETMVRIDKGCHAYYGLLSLEERDALNITCQKVLARQLLSFQSLLEGNPASEHPPLALHEAKMLMLGSEMDTQTGHMLETWKTKESKEVQERFALFDEHLASCNEQLRDSLKKKLEEEKQSET